MNKHLYLTHELEYLTFSHDKEQDGILQTNISSIKLGIKENLQCFNRGDNWAVMLLSIKTGLNIGL